MSDGFFVLLLPFAFIIGVILIIAGSITKATSSDNDTNKQRTGDNLLISGYVFAAVAFFCGMILLSK